MIILTNKKAYFDYSILDKFVAGVKLKGFEAKALREGKGKLDGSYVKELDGKLKVVNFGIGRYSKISQKLEEGDISRTKELLLNKKEITEIKRELAQKGKSCVPLNLRIERGLFKLEIGIVKGKKEYEKKVVAKEKQEKREMEKEKKKLGTWA
jgi:SsrA-binding protein